MATKKTTKKTAKKTTKKKGKKKPKTSAKEFVEQHQEYVEKPNTPVKMGRPSSYKPEYAQMLIDHMREGFNFETFAARLNYQSVSNLYKWLDMYPEFGEAKKVGDALSQLWWLSLGRQAAQGLLPNFNSTVWIFAMKNMFRWRDKPPEEISDKIQPLVIELPNAEKTIQIQGGKK